MLEQEDFQTTARIFDLIGSTSATWLFFRLTGWKTSVINFSTEECLVSHADLPMPIDETLTDGKDRILQRMNSESLTSCLMGIWIQTYFPVGIIGIGIGFQKRIAAGFGRDWRQCKYNVSEIMEAFITEK